jgi:hypothetical protein
MCHESLDLLLLALHTKVFSLLLVSGFEAAFLSLTSFRHLEGSEIRDATYSVVPCGDDNCWRLRPSRLCEHSFFCDDVVGIDFESLDGKEAGELALEDVHGGSTWLMNRCLLL